MRIPLDQGAPAPLEGSCGGTPSNTAVEQGWSGPGNREVPNQAEADGCDLPITTDRHVRRRQNLVGRELAIMVLPAALRPRVRRRVDTIQVAVARAGPGAYVGIPT